MRERVQTPIQPLNPIKPPMTQIALPTLAIKREPTRRVLSDPLLLSACCCFVSIMPFDLRPGYDAVRVPIAHHAQDRGAVQRRRVGAGARLEAVDWAAGAGVVVQAVEGVGEVAAVVDFGV